MDINVRAARPTDEGSVRRLIATAFEDPEVAVLWDALAERSGTVSLVGERDGAIVGHVGLSWGWIDARDRLVDVMILSPLSVEPTAQRTGVGRALVARAVHAASEHGAPVLFLEGDPDYYGRLGFEAAGTHGFTAPSVRIPPAAFQCVLLATHDVPRGALVYPEAFWAHDSVGLRGERLARFGI